MRYEKPTHGGEVNKEKQKAGGGGGGVRKESSDGGGFISLRQP